MLKDLLFKSEEKNKKTKYIHIFITLLYFLFHLILVLRHEHWMDEAQAWVMSKNLTVKELFQVLCSDGHPCLWFIFLMPFSKNGFSYYNISFISLLIMSVVSFVFLEKAPFSLPVKIGIHLSSVFLFYNPVVCRTYSLAALLVICVAAFYKKRFEHPIIYGLLAGLLFQSHVLVFGLAIGLMLEMFYEAIKNRKNTLCAAIIMLSSMMMSIMELMPNASHKPGADTSVSKIINSLSINGIASGLQRFAYTSWGWTDKKTVFLPFVMFTVFIILIFVYITIEKKWKENFFAIFTAVCSCGVFFGVVILVYSPHAQMASILPMMILFIMWQLYSINSESMKIKNTVVCFLTLISFLTFIPAQSNCRTDFFGRYSYSKDAADEILSQIGSDSGVVLMENQTYNSSVYSYVSSKLPDVFFYDLYNKDPYIFCEFGIEYKDLSKEEILSEAKRFAGEYDTVVLLLNKKIEDNEIRLIYTNENDKNLWNELYYIYILV